MVKKHINITWGTLKVLSNLMKRLSYIDLLVIFKATYRGKKVKFGDGFDPDC